MVNWECCQTTWGEYRCDPTVDKMGLYIHHSLHHYTRLLSLTHLVLYRLLPPKSYIGRTLHLLCNPSGKRRIMADHIFRSTQPLPLHPLFYRTVHVHGFAASGPVAVRRRRVLSAPHLIHPPL